jgi:hypothetical protein
VAGRDEIRAAIASGRCRVGVMHQSAAPAWIAASMYENVNQLLKGGYEK